MSALLADQVTAVHNIIPVLIFLKIIILQILLYSKLYCNYYIILPFIAKHTARRCMGHY